MVTDESVRGILHHLPKDLPQAFNQALLRISDRQYGDRIFQLVAAAAVVDTHLTGEELNVALTVQPGDPTWNGTKLPRSPKQVVTRCGGGLLEIDEEDNCVRFIHHSVQSHLYGQKTAMDGRDLPRGWLADANSFMGSVCVTYLNFGEFDRRMASRQVIDPNLVSEKLKKEAACSNPIVASVVRHIKGDKQRKVTPEQLNIFPILLRAQARDIEEMRCFSPYASRHWAEHTARLSEENGSRIDTLWKALAYDRPPHVSVPWNRSLGEEGGMLEYAFGHLHEHLYRCIINEHLEDVGIITFSRRFVVDGISTTKCFAGKEQLEWLMMMIEKCLASPSLIAAAYCLALLYIYLRAQQSERQGLYAQSSSLQHTIRNHWPTPDELFGSQQGHMATQHLHVEKISVETAASRLWSLIGRAYLASPTVAVDAVGEIAVPAVLEVLASMRPSTENPHSMEEPFFACLGVVARTKYSDTFSKLWGYVCEQGIPGHIQDRQHLGHRLLEYACLHTDLNLVRMVTIHQTIELPLFEKTLRRVKCEAELVFRSHIRQFMTPTGHVIKRPSINSHIERDFAAVQGYLKRKEQDLALALIRASFASYRRHNLDKYVVQVLRLVIVSRCDTVLQRMPRLLRAMESWPTVLIDTMVTFALEPTRSLADEDAASERNIFFALLEEVKKSPSQDLFLIGWDDRAQTKSDSGWTALHAAALWQGYAVQALLMMSASTGLTVRQTRSGLTPLIVALCGDLNQEDVCSVVNDLLSAKSRFESETWPSGDSDPNPPVSPLDCSIALRSPRMTQMLVRHGIGHKPGSPTETDNNVQTYIKIVALLESKVLYWDKYSAWRVTVEEGKSIASYYGSFVRTQRGQRDQSEGVNLLQRTVPLKVLF